MTPSTPRPTARPRHRTGSLAALLAAALLTGCASPGTEAPSPDLRGLAGILRPGPTAADIAAKRAEILRALAQVPAQTILTERTDPLMLEAMILLEADAARLQFQAASGRRLGLDGPFIASLQGFGVDLIDLEFDTRPVLLPDQPALPRSLVTLDAQGRTRRDRILCQMRAFGPAPGAGTQRLHEVCRFGDQDRENWYDITLENPAVVASRQWVSADVAITFTVPTP